MSKERLSKISTDIETYLKEKAELQNLVSEKKAKLKEPLPVSELEALSREIAGHEDRIAQIGLVLLGLEEQKKACEDELKNIKISGLTSELKAVDIKLHERLREKMLCLDRVTEIEREIDEVCDKERNDIVAELKALGKNVPGFPFGSIHINLLSFDITNSFSRLIDPLTIKDYVVDIDKAIEEIKRRDHGSDTA